ncbi:mitogen-activated protein kinase-binding protein 1, partial [Bemisia tabaci]
FRVDAESLPERFCSTLLTLYQPEIYSYVILIIFLIFIGFIDFLLQIKLEKVLGLTVSSNAALDCDPNTGHIVYPAGCTVVIFNQFRGKQHHLLNAQRKTVTCVDYSSDGKFLVTGECGHQPCVRVWDLADNTQLAEFAGHKYGINCVAFSPNQKFVVSVGSQHDMIVNVWEWRSNLKAASNKVSSKVKAIAFAENGSYFVTVGNRHVKFWYLQSPRSNMYKEPVPLMGRSAILGEQRNNDFVDVVCGQGTMGDSTYVITRSGLLCEFNNRRLLYRWVELRTPSANCMAIGVDHIFIGCAEGIIRCFHPVSLQFITTLPRTHYLGVDIAQGLNISHMTLHPKNAKYPDAIAVAFDDRNKKLTCVYNDHSLYVWDVTDIKRVGKSHSFLFHSACIWGVEVSPATCKALPPGSFITCSSDDTVRIWNMDDSNLSSKSSFQRNIYSNELLKVMYIDEDLNYIKDMEINAADKSDSSVSYDGRNGVRAIRISPDGKHLASGDRSGNIRIHELSNFNQLCLIEAHDAEVLYLEYTKPDAESSDKNLLASASRDRLIHVFNVDEDYNFIQTLDDHSSSITAVRFINSRGQVQMVSCGADKSIIFRQLQKTPNGKFSFSRGHNVAVKTTLYDMEVDITQKHILTACQDRNIRVYNVNSGKHSKSFKGSVGEDGSLIKVVLDASGIFVATSSTDKTLCIYDYYSGECMATMTGHSELVTGLRFSLDCQRLISASGDGCIFVWTIPRDMVTTMHARISQQTARLARHRISLSNGLNFHTNEEDSDKADSAISSDPLASYRFNDSPLPLWAKSQRSDNDVPVPASFPRKEIPKGRWAQRLDPTGLTIKSIFDSDSIIHCPLSQDCSDNSKEDSSVDSGAETSHSLYPELRKDSITPPNKLATDRTSHKKIESNRTRYHTDDSSLGSFKYYEDNESTEHDGDVEDYSEGEFTESEHHKKIIYYPIAEESMSKFTVNAMDKEELRRSQRRMKQQKREKLIVSPLETTRSVSGSQDSDDDELEEEDDESSTLSAHNPDKTLTPSAFTSEPEDGVSLREKYLKNTFESLSGAELESSAENTSMRGKTSLSSQFHNSPLPRVRNVSVIQAVIDKKNDKETMRKREELQRRIEETRRKLQSVGTRSNLKSSQSTTDLSRSNFSDSHVKHTRKISLSNKHHAAVISEESSSSFGGSIRRACSLSDLVLPAPHRQRIASAKVSNSSKFGPRTSSKHSTKGSTSSMIRSSSVGVLNQSDSESDAGHRTGGVTSLSSRIMRPTIASQNKVVSNVAKNNFGSRRRITSSYSSMNLYHGNEDSSSEEAPVSKSSSRPRSASIDRTNMSRRTSGSLGRSESEHNLARTSKGRTRPVE